MDFCIFKTPIINLFLQVTYALYQILLDRYSSIIRVKSSSRLDITYSPVSLAKIPGLLADNPKIDGIFVDVIAIPVFDHGPGPYIQSPRKITLIDQSQTIGESYKSFVRKRALVKYQSQIELIKVMLWFHTLKKPLNFEKF